MIDVQNLINNIKTVTSKALCTWGEFIAFLSTELQYFKQKGGIQVNPPTVVLPDGVTTTTLISQSEMTQFVTNTLNVWIASINQSEPQPVVEGYDLSALIEPKIYNADIGSASYSWPSWCKLLTEADVRFFDYYMANANKAFKLVESGEPKSYPYHYYTNMTYGEPDNNPRVVSSSVGMGGMVYADLFPLFALNSYSSYALRGNPLDPHGNEMKGMYHYLTARFSNIPLASDYSNLLNIVNNTTPVGIGVRHVPLNTGSGLSNEEQCVYIYITPYNSDPNVQSTSQYVGARRILISRESYWEDKLWATNQNELYPIMEISQDEPWFTTGPAYNHYFKLCMPYPIFNHQR